MPSSDNEFTDQILPQMLAEAPLQPPTAGSEQGNPHIPLTPEYTNDATRQYASSGSGGGEEPPFEEALARLLLWLRARRIDHLALLVTMAAEHREREQRVPELVGPCVWAWVQEVSS